MNPSRIRKARTELVELVLLTALCFAAGCQWEGDLTLAQEQPVTTVPSSQPTASTPGGAKPGTKSNEPETLKDPIPPSSASFPPNPSTAGAVPTDGKPSENGAAPPFLPTPTTTPADSSGTSIVSTTAASSIFNQTATPSTTPVASNSVQTATPATATVASDLTQTVTPLSTTEPSDVSAPAEPTGTTVTPPEATPETCDGEDNDLDGLVDEGLAAQRCTTNLAGICAAGTTRCSGGSVVCESNLTPAPETCDGLDNDCDGRADEDFPQLRQACTAGAGVCEAAGRFICSSDGLSAECDAVPNASTAETCNGLDDDCNGAVDETFSDLGTACAVGAGQCTRNGTWICSNDGLSAVCSVTPGAASAELCDGVDNDCDGLADEDFPNKGQACSAGAGTCQRTGVFLCSANGASTECSATPGAPTAEICDGYDNDCDTAVDEGTGGGACSTGQSGVCGAGTQVCSSGILTCVGAQSAGTETCDGLDNDCDGQTDEALGGASCATGDAGVCSAGTLECASGNLGCTATNAPSSEICDGQDNDCNGSTDESFADVGQACSSGVGECLRTGTTVCSGNGLSTSCTAAPGSPSDELCDGLDNDCNGSTDEAFIDLGQSCSEGIGACSGTGTIICSNDGLATLCSAVSGEPSAESCDGIDNDCDGVIDDDSVCTPSAPAGLYHALNSTSSITLRWSDTSNNESGFVLEQRVGPGGAFAILQDNLAANWPTTNVTPAGGQEYGYRVYAWNSYGNSLPTNEVVIAPPPSVGRRIAGGLNHTCALRYDGTVLCWGSNAYGQLGNWTVSSTSTPVLVCAGGDCTNAPVTLTGVRELAAGLYHTCALMADGSAKCWGLNDSAQLGIGSLTNSSTPKTVISVTGATAITAGSNHTCALKSNGSMQCWGSDAWKQVSGWIGLTGTFTKIVAGGDHTCAERSDNALWCWGRNDVGQLGDGTQNSAYGKAYVAPLVGANTVERAIAAGARHTCALFSTGDVKCWGLGTSGQLGYGFTNNQLSPVSVVTSTAFSPAPLLTGVADLSVGRDHTCAVLSNGTLKCWGYNAAGELGNGGSSNALLPSSTVGPTGTARLDAGQDQTCVVLFDGGMKCWGAGTSGQIGNGGSVNAFVPQTVLNFP